VLGVAGYLALVTTLLVEEATPGGLGGGSGPALTAVEWLAVPVVAGTLGALAESLLLYRHRPAVGASLPPRSSPAWWLGVLASLAITMALLILPVWDLPEAVNAWGYATGTEASATFVGQFSYQECTSDDSGNQSCAWYTDGYLVAGHQHAVWPGYVAAGQAQRVSRPLWDWLHGDQLINGAGNAALEIILGLVMGLSLIGSVFVGRLTTILAANLVRDIVT